jgi:diguanylate cyclase (GGDEF)-like protein
LLSPAAEPRSLQRALQALIGAFDCDGVALRALGPSGTLEPWCARGAWQTTHGDLRGCLSVPLLRGDERIGTLELIGRPGQSWRPAQMALIRSAAGALGAALGARIELGRLRTLPGRDALTGLPDAGAFHGRLGEELARARRHGLPVSVLVVDVDHLAAINQRYGRAAGDAVLAEAALVLRLALRETDILARLAGDDYAVLLPETDRESAVRCADRVMRALEQHRFPRAGHISTSAGVAASPVDGTEAVELLGAAERAVGLAKKAGRRRVVAAAPSILH